MSQATLRIQKISGHAGSVPGEDTQRAFTVCKLIDTTTCIGCKACEVACMEWNDLPFGETGCGYCITGCPFNIPKFNQETKRVFKCTLCVDRVSEGLEPACIKSCPTGCLHFGTKDDMKDLAETRATQLRDNFGFEKAGVYDPAGVGGTGVIYVLHDATNPEAYGGLPKDPHVPWVVRFWKGPAKWIGNLAMLGGIVGVTLHYLRFGPKEVGTTKDDE